MTIRITGMNSGLDTDSIIKELIKAKSEKVEKLKKEQTKLSWTQDAWSTTNTKIKSFYNKYLSDMRFESNYKKKTTTVSNTSLASVVAGDSAVDGSQSLVVKQLAKSGYLTGGKLSDNKSITSASTLNDSLTAGLSGTGTIDVTVKGKTTSISVDGSSSVGSIITQLGKAGLQANFDATNQRVFISVAASGAANDFSLTATNEDGLKALSSLGLVSSDDITKNADYTEWSSYYAADSNSILNNIGSEKVATYTAAKASTLQSNVTSLQKTLEASKKSLAEIQEKLDKAKESERYQALSGSTDAEKMTSAADLLEAASDAITANSEKREYIDLSAKDAESLTDEEKTKLEEYQLTYGDVSSLDKDALEAESVTLKENLTEAKAAVQEMSAINGYNKSITELNDTMYQTYTDINNNAIALNDYYTGITTGTTLDEVNKKLEYIELSNKNNTTLTTDEVNTLAAYQAEYGDVSALDKKTLTAQEKAFNNMATNQALMDEGTQYAAEQGKDALSASSTINIQSDTETELVNKVNTAHTVVNNADTYASGSAVRVFGQDAIIELNNAEFQSSTNNFTVNDLTITAKQLSNITGYQTVDGEEVPIYEEASINTSDDITGVYDMIKEFITQYNSLIKELDTLYGADSSKGYEPLTDEEKDTMTDTEIEKWEQKIKDALLKGDSDLGSVVSGLKMNMLSSFTVNGSKLSLASFGIETLGYFSSEENERGCFHIDGNSEDSTVSGEKDKLKAAISSDPDSVMKFFSQLATTVYDKLTAQMRTTQYSSIYTVYQDKKMKSDYDDYDDLIDKEQQKLNDAEDKYYKQFSAMETAMSKLNSQQSSLSSLLGQS